MPRQGQLEVVAAAGLGVPSNRGHRFTRQVPALKQTEQILLLKAGISRQRDEHTLGGFTEEALNVLPGRSGGGAFCPLA